MTVSVSVFSPFGEITVLYSTTVLEEMVEEKEELLEELEEVRDKNNKDMKEEVEEGND